MTNLDATIALIRAEHRQRHFALEQRKRADLALGAFVRLALGWQKDLPDVERKAIASQASALIDVALAEHKGKADAIDEPTYIALRPIMLAAMASRDPWDQAEKRALKSLTKLTETLPVWSEWASDIRGYGAPSLGMIVAEAGDLSNYPKKGHLWKRMGLAVVDGVRQGGLRKGASADDWIAHGYSAVRRSRMWNVGDAIKKTAGSPYRDVYLARKAYEVESFNALGFEVRPSAEIAKIKDPAVKAACVSVGHVDKRAQRYMEKRLLRDTWQAWRNLHAA